MLEWWSRQRSHHNLEAQTLHDQLSCLIYHLYQGLQKKVTEVQAITIHMYSIVLVD